MLIREEKEIKGIQIGKEEVKLSLFADDMILYIENTKDLTTTRSHQEFCKFVGYKVNILKSVVYRYSNNERSGKETKETIPFTITL